MHWYAWGRSWDISSWPVLWKNNKQPPCHAWRSVLRMPVHTPQVSPGSCWASYQQAAGRRAVTGRWGLRSHFQGLASNPGWLCSSSFLLEGGTLWVSASWLCFTAPISAKDFGALGGGSRSILVFWRFPCEAGDNDLYLSFPSKGLNSVTTQSCAVGDASSDACEADLPFEPVWAQGLSYGAVWEPQLPEASSWISWLSVTQLSGTSSATGSLWTSGQWVTQSIRTGRIGVYII